MPYIEVDQSGKIEQFGKDTVIAFSNGNHDSVILPRKVKQEVFVEKKAKIRNLVLKMFSICLFYLLDGHIENKESVMICKEYFGWEFFIKRELLELLKERSFDKGIIRFGIIGKKSDAHRVALLTGRKAIEPGRRLRKEEIIRYLK